MSGRRVVRLQCNRPHADHAQTWTYNQPDDVEIEYLKFLVPSGYKIKDTFRDKISYTDKHYLSCFILSLEFGHRKIKRTCALGESPTQRIFRLLGTGHLVCHHITASFLCPASFLCGIIECLPRQLTARCILILQAFLQTRHVGLSINALEPFHLHGTDVVGDAVETGARMRRAQRCVTDGWRGGGCNTDIVSSGKNVKEKYHELNDVHSGGNVD